MTLALLLSLVSIAGPNPGADRSGLALAVDACLELDTAALRETLDLSLGAGVEHRGEAAPGPGDAQLLLGCSAEGQAELTLIDPLSDTSATRTVALPPPERRAEQLAWAAAALIRGAWMQISLDPRARPEDRASRRAARAARRPSSAWQIGDGFATRTFFADDSPRLMLGEQVEVLHRPTRHFAWTADGELAYWRVPRELDGARERVNTLSISAAPALLVWGEFPSARPRGLGTLALYAGAGVRVGGVRMRSSSFGDSEGFLPYAGPLATARASVALGRFVGLALELEAGWILHGPERPNDVPVSLIGPWLNGVIVIVSRF